MNKYLINLQNIIHESEISNKINDYNSLLYVYKFLYESYEEKFFDLKSNERLILTSELDKYYDKCILLKKEIEDIIENDIKHAISICESEIYFEPKIKNDIIDMIKQTQNWEYNPAVQINIEFDVFNMWTLNCAIQPVKYYEI
jgi:hypothetical protein